MSSPRISDIEYPLRRDYNQHEESDLQKRIRKDNQILAHNYQKPTDKTLSCALECCDKEFDVILLPGQLIYPKYCEDHRTEFRREQSMSLWKESQKKNSAENK